MRAQAQQAKARTWEPNSRRWRHSCRQSCFRPGFQGWREPRVEPRGSRPCRSADPIPSRRPRTENPRACPSSCGATATPASRRGSARRRMDDESANASRTAGRQRRAPRAPASAQRRRRDPARRSGTRTRAPARRRQTGIDQRRPNSTSTSACITLTAERGKIGVATSPIAITAFPAKSATQTAPWWRLSVSTPRVTSTNTGLPIELRHLLSRRIVEPRFRRRMTPWAICASFGATTRPMRR